MYLYRNHHENAFHWGHISSHNLICWRRHPDALTVENGDGGCYSGGAFVDDDGTAYITFWKFPAVNNNPDCGGIALACSRPPYDVWERMEPIAVESNSDVWGVTDLEVNGKTIHVGSADPSNIWKDGEYYYMQTGNLPVLNEYGRKDDSEKEYRGGWNDLFRSRDLKNWEYCHRFFARPEDGYDVPDDTEDSMCSSFLPLADKMADGKLTNKYLQLFISHNKGAQYYVGEKDGEYFIPEKHGRFSWKDNSYFAPEALVDDRNRQISWSWLLDNDPESFFVKYGWNGTFSFPRCFWIEGDELKMAPAEEINLLMYNKQSYEIGSLDGFKGIETKNGESFRLTAEIVANNSRKFGFRVRAEKDMSEYTEIGIDSEKGVLYFDAEHSGTMGRNIVEEAPFTIPKDGKVKLDIFVDKSIVEVYANDCQAICRRIFPTNPQKATFVSAFAQGACFSEVKTWEMSPSNLY